MSALAVLAPISYIPYLSYYATPLFAYMSMMVLSTADLGGWLTPLTAVDHNNGSWTFTTNSPHFNPNEQVSMTLEGNFSHPLEIEYLFSVYTNESWSKLVEFDQQLSEQINWTLHKKLSPQRKELFGFPDSLDLDDKPTFTDNVTIPEYFGEYYTNTGNWPKQFLGMLQVYTWAIMNGETDFINALTPSFLHFKTNLYNLNRQLFL